ncbi:LppU/SCO3897 family protein [Streptacidiphilus monticola]|uniref:Toxin-antitoxin system, toxin component n=1 Tax=Streptacidiphilus monticola TaxID=2161674 RepID=A0ABW1FXI3_9ACTN
MSSPPNNPYAAPYPPQAPQPVPQPVSGNPYAQPAPGNPYAQPQPQPYGQPQPYAQPQPYGQPVADNAFAKAPQAPLPPQAPPQGAGWGQPVPPPPPAPQDQFPPQYPQFQQQPQFAGAPPEPNGVNCRFCGAYPAVDTTVRAHRGMIVIMQWRHLRGPFCRTCGIASVRRLTADTLWQGWWGYGSAIITPFILLRNLFAYNKIKKLPAPAPGQPGQQMDPGQPLLRRPAALGFLIPIAALVVLIAAIALSAAASASSPQYAKAGDCVVNQGTTDNPDVKKTACGPDTYKVLAKVDGYDNQKACPSAAEETYSESEGGSDYTLCLAPFQG